ncbi:ABC transporter substrate-binding protein [Leptolyngbya sp. BL0902]|uniref:ABC transporter substrate-binding protein n=1 Tax=Leptolyngbya sp. BL0902 TaxID=1115757 RepID=UPI001936D932|nr:ABC transporter substrate-binding protein [Leptolyngbya sp. BL0902]QQE66037.1 ABC transporter substrate-binding protein [Leptolyngbya sp. BL0902]
MAHLGNIHLWRGLGNRLWSLLRAVLRRRWRWLGLALLSSAMLWIYSPVAVSQSPDPVTISFLVRAVEAEQLQPLADAFMAENPDIRIDIVRGPNSADAVENLYTTSFLLRDSPYDLVYADVVWIPKLAAAGWLVDLSDRVDAADLAEFLEADIVAGQYQDGLYRMPFRSDMGMLYYRTDLLDAAGLSAPDTFDELISASQTLQDRGDVPWGFVWQGLQYEGLVTNFVEIVAGFGGFWVDADSLEVGLDAPEAIQAVEFMRGVITDGITPPGVTNYLEEDSLRQFEAGNAAFLRNWPYVWAEANRPGSPVAGNIALKPMVHAPGQSPAACLGGWGFGLSNTSPHPDEAWRVVDYFTSPAVMKRFVVENAYVPSRRALFTDPEVLAAYPHFQQLLEVAETTVPRPPVGQYAQLSDILQRYLSAALTNQLSPEAAMEAAARESRRVLGTV